MLEQVFSRKTSLLNVMISVTVEVGNWEIQVSYGWKIHTYHMTANVLLVWRLDFGVFLTWLVIDEITITVVHVLCKLKI